MTDPEPEPGLDQVLERLEAEIARLADGTAPVDDLVTAHESAQRLIDQAQAQLRRLLAEVAPVDRDARSEGE